jgi:hypothetical protein
MALSQSPERDDADLGATVPDFARRTAGTLAIRARFGECDHDTETARPARRVSRDAD